MAGAPLIVPFIEIVAGGILLTAGVTGHSPLDVITGKARGVVPLESASSAPAGSPTPPNSPSTPFSPGAYGAAASPQSGAGFSPGAFGAASSGAVKSLGNGLVDPLGAVGKLIGTPGVGSHSWTGQFRNWQSDNAIDISVPVGTPVYAPDAGQIYGGYGSFTGNNPFLEGQRINLKGSSNNYYLAHLSKIVVPDGATVSKGQLLGYSGSANGTAHLHLATQNGNPQSIFKGAYSG